MRANYFEFEAAWRKAIADAGPSPVDQIKAVITTILNPPIAVPEKIAIWVAYWGEAPSRKTYLEICSAHDLEWDNAIENILRLMVDDDFKSHGMTLAAVAQTLTAMMDGF